MTQDVTIPLDSDIGGDRNRWARTIVLACYVLLVIFACILFARWLGGQFFSGDLMQNLCTVIGFAASVGLLFISVEKLFIIRNDTTGMFITQNTVSSLLGKGTVNIAYGPGTHISYPWERRLGENNILLGAAANEFHFTVQCIDGTLTGSGSFRVRPNQMDPVTFLSSVSAVADDISDLIVQEIIAELSGKSVKQSLASLGSLNEHLDTKFRKSDADVEERCGVQIDDVTVSKLLPSGELQRTLSAISEAEAVARGVEIILGVKNQDELADRLRTGTITQDEVTRARRDFLSISGNLEGLEIKRQEFDFNIRGLDSDAIKAITDLAKTPAAQAAAVAAVARKSGGQKKGTQKP